MDYRTDPCGVVPKERLRVFVCFGNLPGNAMRLRDIPVRGEGKVEEREAGKQNGRSVMTPRDNTI